MKALTGFPSVLGNMDKNLSWTSSLGDAYYNQQQDVMDAVQFMRQKAQAAGNPKSTDQQTVQDQGSSIVIQPTNPQIVYVPAYNPWGIYGYPVSPWPYWYNYPGIWYGGPYFNFGIGFGVGWYGGYGWGWNHWGANWAGTPSITTTMRITRGATRFITATTITAMGGYNGVTNNVNRGFNGNHDQNLGRNGAGEQHAAGNVYNHPGATTRSVQREYAGGSRLRRCAHTEQRPQRSFQRIQPGRPDAQLFVTRQPEFWRRWRIARRRFRRRRWLAWWWRRTRPVVRQ